MLRNVEFCAKRSMYTKLNFDKNIFSFSVFKKGPKPPNNMRKDKDKEKEDGGKKQEDTKTEAAGDENAAAGTSARWINRSGNQSGKMISNSWFFYFGNFL